MGVEDPLLVREGRTMVPTPYAESLAKPARDVLDCVTAILAGPGRRRSGTGRVVLPGHRQRLPHGHLRHAPAGAPEVESPGIRLWVSPAEAQLDRLGINRNTEITTAFGLAPLLLHGTRRIALVHERLARQLADQTSLRLLEPPMPLEPIHQLLLWADRAGHDPGHRWIRNRIVAFAEERDRPGPSGRPRTAGYTDRQPLVDHALVDLGV